MAVTTPAPSLSLPAPRANDRLVGHVAARAAFTHAWRAGRMAHAWILCGPPGIGKATLAYAMARFALCQGEGGDLGARRAHDPDFRLIAAGSHPDLLTIERPMDSKGEYKKAEIPVDAVRQMGAFLAKSASRSGGWRVIVVDEADCLNRHGQNALLKNLEEPPERSLIVLTTTHAQALLPTIRSRGRMLALSPLSEPEMTDALRGQMDPLAPQDQMLMMSLAQGAPGRLQAMVDVGGATLYHELMSCLADPVQTARRLALAERCAGREGQSIFSTLMEWLAAWLGRLVTSRIRGQPLPCLIEEETLAVHALLSVSTDVLMAVAESLRAKAREAQGINLDRKAVFWGVFGLLC